MGHFVYLMLSLYNRKKTLLSNGRNYGKRKEELNSFELTQVFFGLLSLLSKNFQAKINIFTLIKWAKISVWCHSLCTAPCFHDTICKKTITKRCDWCKISKCYDMTGARYIPLCGNLIRARHIPKCGDLNTTLRANVELFLFFPKRKISKWLI